jgi:hypothetical protein
MAQVTAPILDSTENDMTGMPQFIDPHCDSGLRSSSHR